MSHVFLTKTKPAADTIERAQGEIRLLIHLRRPQILPLNEENETPAFLM